MLIHAHGRLLPDRGRQRARGREQAEGEDEGGLPRMRAPRDGAPRCCGAQRCRGVAVPRSNCIPPSHFSTPSVGSSPSAAAKKLEASVSKTVARSRSFRLEDGSTEDGSTVAGRRSLCRVQAGRAVPSLHVSHARHGMRFASSSCGSTCPIWRGAPGPAGPSRYSARGSEPGADTRDWGWYRARNAMSR